jgi:hypothetical protein
MLTRLLRCRLKDDGVTFDDEDDLKDTMATMYLGTFYYFEVRALVNQRLAGAESVCWTKFISHYFAY